MEISAKIRHHQLIIVITVFLLTRLINLTLLPIFADEANYLDWGWREVVEGKPWHSLYDGKQPLLMWMFGLAQLLPLDPLAASRLVPVLFGLLSLVGLYKITHDTTPLWLYVVTPLFLFYDRQALMEGPLVAISIWSFYLLTRFLRLPNLKTAATVGAVLGMGFFIKSTTLVFITTALIITVLYAGLKHRLIQYSTPIIFLLMSLALVIMPLIFQPQFWSTLSFNSRYSLSLQQIFSFPWQHWATVAKDSFEISFWHLTPVIFVAGLIGFTTIPRLLKLWILIPMVIFLLTTQVSHFRYLAPFLPLMLIPASNCLQQYRWAIAFLVIPASICALLIFQPVKYFQLMSHVTQFSYIEGYVTGDSTGYQVMQTISYLKQLGQKQKIIVGLALNAGNPEAAIITYFNKNPNVTTAYLDLQILPEVEKYDCLASEQPVYFVAREQQQGGLNKFFQTVITIRNPYNQDYHTIYTLKSNCTGKTLNLSLTKQP